jgi:hypothetical protein
MHTHPFALAEDKADASPIEHKDSIPEDDQQDGEPPSPTAEKNNGPRHAARRHGLDNNELPVKHTNRRLDEDRYQTKGTEEQECRQAGTEQCGKGHFPPDIDRTDLVVHTHLETK